MVPLVLFCLIAPMQPCRFGGNCLRLVHSGSQGGFRYLRPAWAARRNQSRPCRQNTSHLANTESQSWGSTLASSDYPKRAVGSLSSYLLIPSRFDEPSAGTVVHARGNLEQ